MVALLGVVADESVKCNYGLYKYLCVLHDYRL